MSASDGKESWASSNADPGSSRWICTGVVSDSADTLLYSDRNDSRTVLFASPKTFERDAQDSESRWSSAQSWALNSSGLPRVKVTESFAQSGAGVSGS